MNLRRIRTRGKSRSGSGWIVRRLRSMLWRLMLPYVEGIDAETERRLAEDVTAAERRWDGRWHAAAAAAAAGREEQGAAARRLEAGLAALRGEVAALASQLAGKDAAAEQGAATRRLEAGLAALHAEVAALASALAGGRKDAMAVAHRLAGLEEELDRLSPEAQDRLVLAGMPSGARFLLRRHDLIGGIVAGGGEWEPHVRRAIEDAARPDGVAVDAGAYIGLHSVTMSHHFATVHAFEPQQAIYRILCDNLALNGCANVAAHNLALYDRAGPMRLSPPERQEVPLPMAGGAPDYRRVRNAAALAFEVAGEAGGNVRAVALDDLALEKVALIKVDTQGADLRVLRGAEDTIRRCRPRVLFEWERDLGARHGTALEDYHAFFGGLDYGVVRLHETTPGRQADYLAAPR